MKKWLYGIVAMLFVVFALPSAAAANPTTLDTVMMNETQLQDALDNQVEPRITLTGIQSKIASHRFVHVGALTICIVEMKNGFTVTGESACASPGNYSAAVGEKIAYDNTIAKLWPLEGYLLRERLSEAAVTAPVAMAFADSIGSVIVADPGPDPVPA